MSEVKEVWLELWNKDGTNKIIIADDELLERLGLHEFVKGKREVRKEEMRRVDYRELVDACEILKEVGSIMKETAIEVFSLAGSGHSVAVGKVPKVIG
ncbi:MAG: hypothetical protein ACPLOC_03775 [Candidatus Bathyarchaeales archaeon]